MNGLNGIEFVINDGGFNRQRPNEDHVSLLLWEHTSEPSSWDNPIRSFRSLKALEQSGVTAFDPLFAEVYYQVEEYFRRDDTGEVYVGFQVMSTGAAVDWAQTITQLTAGRVRQIGGFISSLSDGLRFQQLANELAKKVAPVVCVVGCDFPVDFANVPDLHLLTYPQVAFLNAGDGKAKGAQLATDLGVTYKPSVGAAIGALSYGDVSESIGHVDRFNMSDSVELESPVFSNGQLLDSVIDATLVDMHDKGWTFFRKIIGVTGTYFNDSKTATELATDFVTLENNRTLQKVQRLSYAALITQTNGKVTVNATTGQLSVGFIEFLTSKSNNAIFPMQQAEEISGFETLIDPSQDILTTSKIEVRLRIVGVGISRNIIVNLGYALSLSSS